MTDRGRRLVLVAGVLFAIAGCARPFDPLEDTRIEAEVKARLVAEKSANLTRVGVVSTKGIVNLSGTVASPDQRARAEALTKGVTGVTGVVNRLDVRPPPS
jgi:osmotically-inducible protein OsmY